MFNVIAIIVSIIIIVCGIILHVYIRKKLKDIEGNSDVFEVEEDKNIVGKF